MAPEGDNVYTYVIENARYGTGFTVTVQDQAGNTATKTWPWPEVFCRYPTR